jgi:DNA-binding IclR family transcriptional regulator
LGYQLYALAARTLESRLVRESLPFLRRVVAATHETAHLCVLRGGSVLTLSSEQSEYAFRGIGWEGVSVAASRTSSGRVLVSDWDETSLRAWYELHGDDKKVVSPMSPIAEASDARDDTGHQPTIVDAEGFLAEVTRIRRRGFATVDEEFELGVVGASAPVYDFRVSIVAAINVSAPKTLIGRHVNEVVVVVAKIAADLSRQLGAPATAGRATPSAG